MRSASTQAGIVGHDVGGALMQPLARAARRAHRRTVLLRFRLSRHRAADGGAGTAEQHLVPVVPPDGDGANTGRRDAARAAGIYIGHFLKAWSHRKDAFDDVLEAFTDNFLKDGNLAGGFALLPRSACGPDQDDEGRGADARRRSRVPTCVRWAEHDPLFPYAWTDRLGETFSNLDLAMFPGVGHFPHREDPDRAAAEIAAFFTRIGWS